MRGAKLYTFATLATVKAQFGVELRLRKIQEGYVSLTIDEPSGKGQSLNLTNRSAAALGRALLKVSKA